MIEVFWQIYDAISYYIGLTFKLEVLWIVIPLFLSTLIIISYFERYPKEKTGWSSYLSSSLVILFVAMTLFREIYNLGIAGFQNYVDFPSKTIASAFLFLVSLILVQINFAHQIPEKFAKYLNSILTIHLIAYAIVLFVFSEIETLWVALVSIFILVFLLSIFFNAIKKPLRLILGNIEKEKIKHELKTGRRKIIRFRGLKSPLKKKKKKK